MKALARNESIYARTNQHARTQRHASICIMGIRGTLQLSVPASRNSFPPGTCLEGEQRLRGALLAVSPSCPLPALLPTGLAVPRYAASRTPGRRGETQRHSVPGPAQKGRRSAKRHQLLGCCRLNVPLSTIGIRGMGSGEWALVLPTPHVPSEQSKWVPKHEIWSILAPDIFSAAQLAWCEVGVTIPGKRFPQHEHYPPKGGAWGVSNEDLE